MRLSVCLGIVVLVAVATAGCAQSNGSELVSPAAPGSVSESLAAGPGAGYDASGAWVIVFKFPRTAESADEEVVFNQHADGNITFLLDSEESLVTLTRLGPGNGRVIAYRVSSVEEVAQCTETASGTVTIDTQTNTGRGQVVFVEEDCTRGTVNLALTKQ
jgi:hypothetical protein